MLRNDIIGVIGEYVPLKKKGSSYFGLCPFHNENTPSFSVNADKQLYYCFGCGAAGNVISFIMQIENYNFVEAVEKLADRAGIQLPKAEFSPEDAKKEKLKERLFELHNAAGRFFYKTLHSLQGREALEYINKRMISQSIQTKFGIGFSPNSRDELFKHLSQKGFSVDEMLKSGLIIENKYKNGYHDRFYNRIMFPIFDVRGRCIAFGGRIIQKGEPKYLNSPETIIFNKKRNLYGINFAKAERKKEIIIVEGYMDMITIYQAGFKNVVASLGTAFSKEHAMLLKKYASDVILVFDSDEAGEKAALRAIPILVDGGLKVKVLQVPNGKDPDEYIKQNGSKEFGKLVLNAVGYMDFKINCAKKLYNLNDMERKMDFTKEAANMISELSSPVERELYAQKVSEQTGVSQKAVEEEVLNIYKKQNMDFKKESEKKRIRNYSQVNNIEKLSNTKGAFEAQKELIYLCASKSEICTRVMEILKPEELRNDVFSQILSYVYNCVIEGKRPEPSEAVNIFTEPDKQKIAANIFVLNTKFEDMGSIVKAVNEEIKIIKKANIDYITSNASTIEEVQEALNLKKQIENFEFKL